jgi:MerR family transcriptional regulator, light-induced transcriptional regulator
MPSTLNIAALSRRTGVAPDTLRKWEQRYGILRPERTQGGQRRYSERDLARVEWLNARVSEGYRISEAARILGGAQAAPAEDPDDLPGLILLALQDTDADLLAALLDQTFGVLSVEDALVRVVAPLLDRIGDAWEAGEITVAQEHLLTSKIRFRLEQLVGYAGGGVRGTAVLACAPGERHELGLLMLAVLMQADGWQVEYLGGDTPALQALALADAVAADVVCFSAATKESAAALRRQLREVPRDGGPAMVAGGHAVDERYAKSIGARYVSGDLGARVRELRAVMS